MLRQILLCLVAAATVSAHMRMLDPPNRSSLWRFPAEFGQYNPEENHMDDWLWCDNIRQYEGDTRCGVCGDPHTAGAPRDNENGGRYGRGIIGRRYSVGQTIPIRLEFPAGHGGGFAIQICDRFPETEDCFRSLVLGNGQTWWPFRLGEDHFDTRTTAKLPDGLRCDHCTLRVHYRGAQNWGTCDNSVTCECDPNSGNPPGGMGCGEQQTFRSCSDISIH